MMISALVAGTLIVNCNPPLTRQFSSKRICYIDLKTPFLTITIFICKNLIRSTIRALTPSMPKNITVTAAKSASYK